MRKLLLAAPMLFAAVSAAQTPRLAKLTEDLRLDATKEDFPRVGGVWVGPREQIVVLVPNDNEFRAYNKEGKKIGAFGRTGSGPGEFRSPASLGWIGDTVWVFDYGLRRISRFGPDLKLLRTDPTPQPSMKGAITPDGNRSGVNYMPFVLLPDGSTLGSGSVSRSAAAAQPWERYIGKQPASGEVTKLPMSPNFEDPQSYMFYAGFYREVPFTVWPQVATSFDGSRLALMTVKNGRDGGEVSISTYATAAFSKPQLTLTLPFKGEPIPSKVRDSVLASFIPPGGRPREGPAEGPQRMQAMARERMPSFYPPVESLILGVDQTVWVLRPTRNDRWSADVYDGKGKMLGRVEPPYKTRIRQGTATHVWTTQRDEDDLISIVRYRIDWQK